MLVAKCCVKSGKNMSRIGRKSITVPQGVTIEITATEVVAKGPKGQSVVAMAAGVTVTLADGAITVGRVDDQRQHRANHGLMRSLIANAVKGVSEGYRKTLKLVGTGYRASMKGKGLSLALGFSHPVEIMPPAGIVFAIEGTDTIHIDGIEKQLVGEWAAKVRKIRPPEPYKGKGIRYEDEVVRRKQGKAAA